MLRLIEDLAQDWRGLDAHEEIAALARQGRRLMSAPGIGQIISSAMVAAASSGEVFTKGATSPARPGVETDLHRDAPY
jgi:transposase